MKKELIITVIIVIGIFITSFITKNYTSKSFAEIDEDLNNIKNDIINETKDNEELISDVQSIYEKWEKKYKYLAYYLEHNELEKVNTQLQLLKGHLEGDDTKEGIPEIEDCLYLLKHLKEKQMLNLSNIF